MPREHYTTACDGIRKLIQSQFTMAAAGDATILHALNFCFGRGYDCTLDDLPLTLTHKVEAAKSEVERLRIRQTDPCRYADEQAALRCWQGRRDWAAQTSLEGDRKAAADKAAAEAKARQDFIVRRAKELTEAKRREENNRVLAQATAEAAGKFPRGAA